MVKKIFRIISLEKWIVVVFFCAVILSLGLSTTDTPMERWIRFFVFLSVFSVIPYGLALLYFRNTFPKEWHTAGGHSLLNISKRGARVYLSL